MTVKTAAPIHEDGVVESSGQAFDAAHAQVLADSRLQFALEPVPLREDPPNWLLELLQLLGGASGLLEILFWLAIAALVLFILVALGRALRRRTLQNASDSIPTSAVVAPYQPTAQRARALLEEADRLAQEGRFNEAARILLLRSIDDLESRSGARIGHDLTSREIEGLPLLNDEGRLVFGRIARAVEVSLFGGHVLDAAAYQSCREAYAAFAGAGAGAGARS